MTIVVLIQVLLLQSSQYFCDLIGEGSTSITFGCDFQDIEVSFTCSFDGEEAEACSIPLVVTRATFGFTRHNLTLTATTSSGEHQVYEFSFTFASNHNVLLKM